MKYIIKFLFQSMNQLSFNLYKWNIIFIMIILHIFTNIFKFDFIIFKYWCHLRPLLRCGPTGASVRAEGVVMHVISEIFLLILWVFPYLIEQIQIT